MLQQKAFALCADFCIGNQFFYYIQLVITREDYLLRFHSYLLTIAKRNAFEYVRKKKEDELLEPERLGVEEQPTFLLAELHDFLDEKENLVMVLHVVYEFSFQEIEEVANIPHSTAKRIYDSALKKAREHYGVRL